MAQYLLLHFHHAFSTFMIAALEEESENKDQIDDKKEKYIKKKENIEIKESKWVFSVLGAVTK